MSDDMVNYISDFLFYLKRKFPTKRDVRFLYQRLTRGWDDSETWSLDYSLAKIILPRLERYRDIVPHDDISLEDLDKMIAAFKFAGSEERWVAPHEEFLKHQEGLKLFADKYFGLWW